MREAFGRLGLVGCLLGVIGLLPSTEGANFSVKAVKKNTTVIAPPVSTLAAAPGDTVELNVFVSGWNSNLAGSRLRTYQFRFNARKGYYNNGGSGYILPKGWNAQRHLEMCESPLDCQGLEEPATTCLEGFCTRFCNQNADCSPPYPTCDLTGASHCKGPGHVPENGGFIIENNTPCTGAGVPAPCCTGNGTGTCVRTDGVFKDFVALSAVNYATLDYDFGSTVIGGGDGPLDAGVEKYAGTLILLISPEACGTYTVGLSTGIESTFVELASGGSSFAFSPTSTSLTINLPGCGACCDSIDNTCSLTTSALCVASGGSFKGLAVDCDPDPCGPCPTFASTNPPNCAIDARYPFAPNSANPRFGFTSAEFTFSAVPAVAPVPADFTVSLSPDPGGNTLKPVIQSVTSNGGASFTLNLDPTKPVPTRRWTCFEYIACEPRPKFCLGALPGDSDQDGQMDTADLLSLIGGLNADQSGNNPLKGFQCDMDRSGACTSGDLVSWVDMAVGAMSFPPFLDGTMENSTVCPTAP